LDKLNLIWWFGSILEPIFAAATAVFKNSAKLVKSDLKIIVLLLLPTLSNTPWSKEKSTNQNHSSKGMQSRVWSNFHPRPYDTTMNTDRLAELGIDVHTTFKDGIKACLEKWAPQ
jgi:hypothetical protein